MTMRISNQNDKHKMKITGKLRNICICFNDDDDFLLDDIQGPNLDDDYQMNNSSFYIMKKTNSYEKTNSLLQYITKNSEKLY